MEFLFGLGFIVFVAFVIKKTRRPDERSVRPPPIPRPRHVPEPRRAPTPAPSKPADLPQAGTATELTPLVGPCYVIDGDTIVIKKVHIRLFGIDAPEMNHPYGKKAKWELVKLCKGQTITATPDGSSSHDRVVAKCTLPDGTDLSAEMVRRGQAIDWPKFSGGCYRDLEEPGIRKRLWRCHNRQTGKYVPD